MLDVESLKRPGSFIAAHDAGKVVADELAEVAENGQSEATDCEGNRHNFESFLASFHALCRHKPKLVHPGHRVKIWRLESVLQLTGR